jgi:putative membrane protein
MDIIIAWIVYAVAILVTAYILPGVRVDGFVSALIVALVLGIINAVFKPILMAITLPINVLTLGLFSLVVNTLIIMFVSYVVPGFQVDGFWWALLYAVILAVISAFFSDAARTVTT